MKRINISINPPLHDRLKRLSHQSGVSVSEMFRRAADAMYGDDKPPPEKKRIRKQRLHKERPHAENLS